jgi:hypothetical protein
MRVSLYSPFQILNQLTDFYEIWYRYYDIIVHANFILISGSR